jgi:hypothetical protein
MFVVVDAVLDGYVPWFVRLAEAVEATSSVRLRDGSTFEMTDRRDKRRFRELAKAHVMAAAAGRENAVVDDILSLPGMQVPEQPRWPFLTLDELRQLQRAGAEIGNHSARHRNLTRCSRRSYARRCTRAEPDSKLRPRLLFSLSRTRTGSIFGRCGEQWRPITTSPSPDGRTGPHIADGRYSAPMRDQTSTACGRR